MLSETWQNIHHVSWHCWKGFQDQRSKIKDIIRPINLHRRSHTDWRWRQGSPVTLTFVCQVGPVLLAWRSLISDSSADYLTEMQSVQWTIWKKINQSQPLCAVLCTTLVPCAIVCEQFLEVSIAGLILKLFFCTWFVVAVTVTSSTTDCETALQNDLWRAE